MALIDVAPGRRERVLDPDPHTILADLVAETGIEVRCHHADRADDGYCMSCGFCPHRHIVREDVGTSHEVQWCESCGEERYPNRGGF